MKPRITVITLGVDDLERSLCFYRDGLGFPTNGIIGQEFEFGAVVFIDLQPGLRLALWPRKSAHASHFMRCLRLPLTFTIHGNSPQGSTGSRTMTQTVVQRSPLQHSRRSLRSLGQSKPALR